MSISRPCICMPLNEARFRSVITNEALHMYAKDPKWEVCPSVPGLSPVSGDLPLSAPIGHKQTRLSLSGHGSKELSLRWARGTALVLITDLTPPWCDGTKPASPHSLPVLHVPFLPSTACFKRYNTWAACPCYSLFAARYFQL